MDRAVDLVILIGLQASGKSTFARQRFAALYTVRIGAGGTFAVCRWGPASPKRPTPV